MTSKHHKLLSKLKERSPHSFAPRHLIFKLQQVLKSKICVWVGAPQNWHDEKVFNRSSRRSCSVKKVFLEILQNSQENTYARDSFFNKVAGQARPATLLKKSLWHRCFPVNFARFLRTPFLKNSSGQLLLFLNPENRSFENASIVTFK